MLSKETIEMQYFNKYLPAHEPSFSSSTPHYFEKFSSINSIIG